MEIAIALIFSGFQMGTIIAYILSPIIMDTFGGWRALFYIYGGSGLLMIIPWLLLAKDTPYQTQQTQQQIVSTNFESVSTIDRDEIIITTDTTQQSSSLQTSISSSASSSWDESLQVFRDAPWNDMIQSKGAWAMLLAHCARNWGLYNTLSWTPTFYAEEYGIGVRESAILSVLPSVAGAAGGFIAGFTADRILRNMQQQQQRVDDGSAMLLVDTEDGTAIDAKTNVRKIFQGISLFGSAASLSVLAFHIPEEAWVAQTFLTASLGLLSFSAAGFDAAIQDKAGTKWAGLLYSVTSLPAVMCK